MFCRSCSTCRCISDVFVGRKVISTSYSFAILKLIFIGILDITGFEMLNVSIFVKNEINVYLQGDKTM